jgi:hypothetical protein
MGALVKIGRSPYINSAGEEARFFMMFCLVFAEFRGFFCLFFSFFGLLGLFSKAAIRFLK